MSESRRLRWLCRRGMKELDLVLCAYLDRHYESAGAAERQCFNELLERPDPELFGLLLGKQLPPDDTTDQLLGLLRKLSSKP